MQLVYEAEGGYNLSFEAKLRIAILAYEELLPVSEYSGLQILMNVHDHIFKDRSVPQEIRMESCNLISDLISELLLSKKEKKKK